MLVTPEPGTLRTRGPSLAAGQAQACPEAAAAPSAQQGAAAVFALDVAFPGVIGSISKPVGTKHLACSKFDVVSVCEKSPDPKPKCEAERLIAILALQVGVRVLRRAADQKWGFKKMKGREYLIYEGRSSFMDCPW